MIRVTNLEKSYPSFKLGPLSFRIPKGKITGFIGENGAGKSTTIKALLGLVHGDAGEIEIAGEEKMDPERTGVVFDEIKFPKDLRIKQVRKILENAYTRWNDEAFSTYLDRFALEETKKVSELSRGMKMKLQLAAALSHDPDILIFDEATSGLDPVARDDILELMREYVTDEQHTIFVSSHQLQDLEKIADHIIFLHQGKIFLDSEKKSLKENFSLVHVDPEVFSRIKATDTFAYRDQGDTVEVLLQGPRDQLKARYPELEFLPYSIDDIILICLKGKIL